MDQEEEESIQSRRNVVTSLIISTHLNRFSFLSFICLHVLFLFLFLFSFFFKVYDTLKKKKKEKEYTLKKKKKEKEKEKEECVLRGSLGGQTVLNLFEEYFLSRDLLCYENIL